MITQKDVLQHFAYVDGELIRKAVEGYNNPYANKSTGWIDKTTGYKRTSYKGKCFWLHRLTFLYHHGYMPEFVDHIDKNPLNNKIENLRPATKSQNAFNSKRPKDNTIGERNVYWHNVKNKYFVKAVKDGKQHHAGYFVDLDEAKIAAKQLRTNLFMEYAP